MDNEQYLLEIYAKLQKENLLEDWKNFSRKIMAYFIKEWGYDNPPSFEEIINVSQNFINNDETLNDINNILNDEEYEFLLSFMIAGFDVIINGEDN